MDIHLLLSEQIQDHYTNDRQAVAVLHRHNNCNANTFSTIANMTHLTEDYDDNSKLYFYTTHGTAGIYSYDTSTGIAKKIEFCYTTTTALNSSI